MCSRRFSHRIGKGLLIAIGWTAVAGGVAGIFLPLVPTVPLLLLAAACFARSSDRFYRWLVEHRQLGPLVRDYLHGAGMPLRAKLTAIAMVWTSISLSLFLLARDLWVQILLAVVATGITIYVAKVPGSRKSRGPDENGTAS